MANTARRGKSENEAPQKSKVVIQRYRDRLSILRQAQTFSHKDDIPRAVSFYMKYLDALAQFFEIPEEKLSPELFIKEKNLAEILLVSQVYWDLSKAYDRSPKLKKECERCLNQFVKFSLGFKFQFINSEMLRKFIKKKAAYNPKLFTDSFEKLKLNSKACYIASYSFHEQACEVKILRLFKKRIQHTPLGSLFVGEYYRFSPKLIDFFNEYPNLGILFNSILIRPTLKFFSKIL